MDKITHEALIPDAQAKPVQSKNQRGGTKKSLLKIMQNGENTTYVNANKPTGHDLGFFLLHKHTFFCARIKINFFKLPVCSVTHY